MFTGAEGSDADLPVMVWFHGGGNTEGHGGPLIFDGSNLAKRGAVVSRPIIVWEPLVSLHIRLLLVSQKITPAVCMGFSIRSKFLGGLQNNIKGFGATQIRSQFLVSQQVVPMFA